MTPAELAEFGSIAHRLVPAIKAATGVERVYLLAVMERAPHFHLWFVPKQDEGQLRGVDYLAQRPPLTSSHSQAEAMSIKIREQLERVLNLIRQVLCGIRTSAECHLTCQSSGSILIEAASDILLT
jgi:hypothetical protein